MIGLVRACRLAAAFVLSLPVATVAQAAVPLTPAIVAPAANGRVMGIFQVPTHRTAPATAMPTATPRTLSQPAPVSAQPLDQLVAGFVPAAQLDDAGECLATAVYFEARGESLDGQLAVAEVVLNRAASGVYPGDVCGVVTQKAQFSFVRGGHLPKADESSESWRKAVAIASIARNGLARSVPQNVLWYHANYVSPAWGKWHTRVSQIGAHIFYS